jgi:hypothetical protein
MATKTRLMKALQEIDGYAEITNRRPVPRPAVLYLMALRLPPPADAPFRKRIIPVGLKLTPQVPRPVKITHRRPGQSDLPVVME